MDPVSFEKAITSRTKAVIPVHLYGQAAEIDDILTIAAKRKPLLFTKVLGMDGIARIGLAERRTL